MCLLWGKRDKQWGKNLNSSLDGTAGVGRGPGGAPRRGEENVRPAPGRKLDLAL